MDIDWLVKKYQDNIVIVDKKRPVAEVIREQVDIKEIPIETLSPTHLKFSMENATHSVHDIPDQKITLHMFQVLLNERSAPYYQDIKNDTTYMAYFEQETVYILVEDTLGIIETNSNLLFRQVKIARGVTQKDLEDKDLPLLDYLSIFNELDDYPKYISKL